MSTIGDVGMSLRDRIAARRAAVGQQPASGGGGLRDRIRQRRSVLTGVGGTFTGAQEVVPNNADEPYAPSTDQSVAPALQGETMSGAAGMPQPGPAMPILAQGFAQANQPGVGGAAPLPDATGVPTAGALGPRRSEAGMLADVAPLLQGVQVNPNRTVTFELQGQAHTLPLETFIALKRQNLAAGAEPAPDRTMASDVAAGAMQQVQRAAAGVDARMRDLLVPLGDALATALGKVGIVSDKNAAASIAERDAQGETDAARWRTAINENRPGPGVGGQVRATAGQMVPLLAGGVPGAVVMGTAAGYGDARTEIEQKLVDRGYTKLRARSAARMAAPIVGAVEGALDAVQVEGLLSRLGGQGIEGLARRVAVDTVIGAGTGAATEATRQGAEVATGAEDRFDMERVKDAARSGAIAQTVIGRVLELAGSLPRPTREPAAVPVAEPIQQEGQPAAQGVQQGAGPVESVGGQAADAIPPVEVPNGAARPTQEVRRVDGGDGGGQPAAEVGPAAGGVPNDAGATRAVAERVPPVVRPDGASAGAQPGDVASERAGVEPKVSQNVPQRRGAESGALKSQEPTNEVRQEEGQGQGREGLLKPSPERKPESAPAPAAGAIDAAGRQVEYARTPGLDERQRRVESELAAIVKTGAAADAAYNAIPATQNGKIVATDLTRELSPTYANNKADRVWATDATTGPARAWSRDRLQRDIDNPPVRPDGEPPRLLITAGSAGSGKTSTLKSQISEADKVWDSQLTNAEDARAVIDRAVSKGWDVTIQYVHRPFHEVFDAVARRALPENEGRPVRMGDVIDARLKAQKVIKQLAEKYADNPKVAVEAIYNSSETPLLTGPIPAKRVAEGGDLAYTEKDLRRIASESAAKAKRSGRFPAEVIDLVSSLDRLANANDKRGGTGFEGARPAESAPGAQDPARVPGEGEAGPGGRGREASRPELSKPDAGKTIEQRLLEFADRERQAREKSNIPRGRGTGATTLIHDLVSVGLEASARAAAAGIKGGKELVRIVREALGPNASDGDVKRATGIARGVLRDVFDGDAVNVDKFNAVTRAVRDVADRTRTGNAAALREATGVAKAQGEKLGRLKQASEDARRQQRETTKTVKTGAQVAVPGVSEKRSEPKTTTEGEALRASLGAAERAARTAYRQGRKEAMREASVSLAEFERVVKDAGKRRADVAAIEKRGAAQAAAAGEKAKADIAASLRDQAVRLLEPLPAEIKGRYLAAVRDATTLGRLGVLARRARRDLALHRASETMRLAERAAGRAKAARELEPELRDQLMRAKGILADAKRVLRGERVLRSAGAVKSAAGSPTAAKTEYTPVSTDEAVRLVDDLENAYNAIVSVRHMQRTMDKVRVRGELVAADGYRRRMIDRLESTKKELDQPSAPEAREVSWAKQVVRNRTNWDSMMLMIDGFKPGGVGRMLWGRVLGGRHNSLRLEQSFSDQVGEIARKHGFKSLGSLLADMSGTLGKAGQKKVKVKVGPYEELTLGEAAYLYASSSDEGFRARIQSGQRVQFSGARTETPIRLSMDDLSRVAAALPDNVKAFVDDTKAAYDTLFFDRLSAVNKRLKGYHLQKVKGYFGIKLNRDFSENRGVPTSWHGNYIRAMEESGYMQEREGPSKTPILIGDFGTDVLRRAKSSATLIGKAETTKMLTQVLLHPDVVPEISKRYGRSTVERLKRRVALYSGGDIYNTGDSAARGLLSTWSRAKTQLWAWTWARNAVAGTPRVLNEIGVKSAVTASLKPSWGAWKELMRYSPELRERWEGGGIGNFYDPSGADVADASMREAGAATVRNLLAVVGKVGNRRESVQSAQDANRSFGRMLDAITVGNYADAMPAIVAYKHFQTVAPKGLTAEGAKKWAARQATIAFERVSNTATIEYANDVQLKARDSLFTASLIPFTGDTAKAQAMLYQAWGKSIAQKDPRPILRTTATLAATSVLSGLVSGVRELALGSDDEKAATSAARRFLQEVTSLAPGGTVLSAVASKYFDKATGTRTGSSSVLDVPLVEMVNTAASIGEDLIEAYSRMDAPQKKRMLRSADLYTRALLKTGRLAGEMIGVPVQYVDEVRKAIKGWSGEDEPKKTRTGR